MEIYANSKMEYVEEIINFLVKNKIFLHLKIRTDCIGSNNEKLLQEQIVRYTPSEEHRKNCKDDLCHINARLDFFGTDFDGFVINSKSSGDHSTITNLRQEKCTVL